QLLHGVCARGARLPRRLAHRLRQLRYAGRPRGSRRLRHHRRLLRRAPVLPYAKTVSPRDNASFGINTIGLERKGVPKESIEALQRAYRILVRSKLKVDEAL